MASSAIVYGFTSASAVALDQASRRYRKELIRVGTWKAGKHRWDVDEALLSHWVTEHKRLAENGVRVPLPLEHTTEPDKNRGWLVDLEKVGESLFGTIEFADDEAAKLASRTDVSIYSPPEFVDGKGNKYYRPITHVALTTQPVVTGLGAFEMLAASHVEEKQMKLSLKTLASKLGVDVADDATDEDIEAAIVSAWEKEPEEEEEEEEPVAASRATIRLLKENRQMKLEKLMQAGKITKAAKDKIVAKHLSDSALSLSLSSDEDGDAFDDLVETLEANEAVVNLKGKSGQQTTRLSHDLKPEDNPLVKDAERRAAAAKK